MNLEQLISELRASTASRVIYDDLMLALRPVPQWVELPLPEETHETLTVSHSYRAYSRGVRNGRNLHQ